MTAIDLTAELPRDETLHCPTCGRRVTCSLEQLHRYIQDDPSWPRCCGTRMAVAFPVPGPPPAGA